MTLHEELVQILHTNKNLQTILNRTHELQVPNWYLGAGGIAQTVWNIKHGFDPENGIKDYDLVYYDARDISYEAEDAVIQKGADLFKEIPLLVEIRNQARVHIWYEKHFGKSVEQYISTEEAISTWPTTATAVGIRKVEGEIQIYAPFGLEDLLNMIIRPNKKLITKQVYENKANRWIQTWPNLKVISWDD